LNHRNLMKKPPPFAPGSVQPAAARLSMVEVMNQTATLNAAGKAQEALALYAQWLATADDPQRYVVWFNYGTALGAAGRAAESEQAHRQALAIQPNFLHARLNLGHQLENQGQLEPALAEWRRVLKDAAHSPFTEVSLKLHALNNLGRALEKARRFDEAETCMRQSLELDPEQPATAQHYVHIRQKQCEWPLYQALGGLTLHKQLVWTSALAMLSAHDDPALQLLAAQRFAQEKVRPTDPRRPPPPRPTQRKVRIGYLSGDLCMHAVGLLTAELYELHDRSRFEVFAFCWSREDGSPLRTRLIKSFDHHVRIGHLDDKSAADLIRKLDIDLLVDLQGITSGARPDILSYRPATVQLSYLGFPGTTGLSSIDYVVGDEFAIPPALQPYMTEKLLALPHCFQVSDRQRDIAATPSRASCQLPENSFVFASFNNNFKFTESLFKLWMRVLHEVPHSVLWLLADNPWAKQNMMDCARAHQVDPARLVFAERAAPADYMARFKLVDLFLDTFPYNAGTTASDALWMGCPILTCAGKTFVSRMAGSLLHAVGLPDLVTDNPQAYEQRAVQLGRDRRMVSTYKRYLDEHRHASALFDMPAFVRDYEAALLRALDAHSAPAGGRG
jgi:predicted O-linked N-acetylglucosamine transferase (SPINDLY family)